MDLAKGVAVSDPLVLAVADYEIPGKGFLPLRANDVIYIIEADASGWWLGMNAVGKKGVLPSTYTTPYVFPPPRAETVGELELMCLAAEYGVDLTSGVPVVPLCEVNTGAAALIAGRRNSVATMDDLYKQTDSAIVARESHRGELTAALRCLHRTRNAATSDSTNSEKQDVVGSSQKACQRALQQLDAEKDKLRALKASLSSLANSLASEKEGLQRSNVSHEDSHNVCVPPHAWYQRTHCALREGGPWLSSTLLDQFSDAGELRDVKRAVLQYEQRLTSLSEEVRSREAQYRNEKAHVQQRIEKRDLAVSRMLAWWADRAEKARSDYLATKAQRLRQAEQGQQALGQRQHELELKRHRFTCVAEELHEARATAKEVQRALQRRNELLALEAQIRTVNKRIADARRRTKKVALEATTSAGGAQ